jgi:hypothetical protein
VHDCLDTNFSAHPNQASYFTTTPTGLSPTYDWNCSGARQFQYSYGPPLIYATCAFGRDGACTGTPWYTTSPTCGGAVSLSHCAVTSCPLCIPSCSRVTSTGYTVACH